jgi:hypothetical protein
MAKIHLFFNTKTNANTRKGTKEKRKSHCLEGIDSV